MCLITFVVLDCARKMSGGNRSCILREQVALGQMDISEMKSPNSSNCMDRLKILINSSTPIVVMETVEEVRALTLVHVACSDLSLPIFEWTIADGLVRSGSSAAIPSRTMAAGSGFSF